MAGVIRALEGVADAADRRWRAGEDCVSRHEGEPVRAAVVADSVARSESRNASSRAGGGILANDGTHATSIGFNRVLSHNPRVIVKPCHNHRQCPYLFPTPPRTIRWS